MNRVDVMGEQLDERDALVSQANDRVYMSGVLSAVSGYTASSGLEVAVRGYVPGSNRDPELFIAFAALACAGTAVMAVRFAQDYRNRRSQAEAIQTQYFDANGGIPSEALGFPGFSVH